MTLEIKRIFAEYDNWLRYRLARKNTLSEYVVGEVERMLHCRDPDKGFSIYFCGDCGEYVTRHFSCNGRLCTKCGKRYVDGWSRQLRGRLFPVNHRHIVFTLPSEFRCLVKEDPELVRVFVGCIQPVLVSVLSYKFRKRLKDEDFKLTPGVACFTHTFGEDLKFHPHFHCLVTEGGVNDCDDWVDVRYISFEALRKVWQYHVLIALKEYAPWCSSLVDALFKRYPKGFYVYAKDTVHKTERGFLQYLARYVRHPAVAESRILSFDDERVSFFCQHDNGVRENVTLSVFGFFDALLQHLPVKGRHLIDYLGLYCNRERLYYFELLGFVVKQQTMAQRMLFRGLPRCPKCGKVMDLIYRQGLTEPSVPPPLGSVISHWV